MAQTHWSVSGCACGQSRVLWVPGNAPLQQMQSFQLVPGRCGDRSPTCPGQVGDLPYEEDVLAQYIAPDASGCRYAHVHVFKESIPLRLLPPRVPTRSMVQLFPGHSANVWVLASVAPDLRVLQ